MMSDGKPFDPVGLVTERLRTARRKTLYTTELFAAGRSAHFADVHIEAAIGELERPGLVVVLNHPPPDVHLEGTDLRTICLVEGTSTEAYERARRNAEAHWQEFLRTFLLSHRCG